MKMASVAICLLAAALLDIGAAQQRVTIMPGGAIGEGSEVALSLEEQEAEQVDSAWNAFVTRHQREFKAGTAEYEMRKALFKKRLAAVHAHNAKPGRLWKAAPSRFSDHTDEERAVMRGYRRELSRARRGGSLLQSGTARARNATLPESKNWTHLVSTQHIRDQGPCGSCWAIATTSVLEAHYEISHTGQTKVFSPQMTLECTPNPHECGGQGGCQGATVELATDWIMKNGIATEEEVPYKAADGTCASEKKGGDIGLIGFHTLAQNEDYPLAEAVALRGPVAVSAAAGGWFEYEHGIYDGCDRDAIVDHAIVLYGYGQENGMKYWLIRNSWGAEWGEKGFIRLKRHGTEKYCGKDTDPAEGTGCKGGPPSVPVCGMCGVLYDSVEPRFTGALAAPSLMRMEAKRH